MVPESQGKSSLLFDTRCAEVRFRNSQDNHLGGCAASRF
jgi:hypothetical protein